jgi:hypothetical protein
MTHGDMTESVKDAFVGDHTICAREHLARLVECIGHGISPF